LLGFIGWFYKDTPLQSHDDEKFSFFLKSPGQYCN